MCRGWVDLAERALNHPVVYEKMVLALGFLNTGVYKEFRQAD